MAKVNNSERRRLKIIKFAEKHLLSGVSCVAGVFTYRIRSGQFFFYRRNNTGRYDLGFQTATTINDPPNHLMPIGEFRNYKECIKAIKPARLLLNL